LFPGFANNYFFTVKQRNDGIRGAFDQLDQVRIHDQGLTIQACKLNHGLFGVALVPLLYNLPVLSLPDLLIGESEEGLR
jgi:hypothetical protein